MSSGVVLVLRLPNVILTTPPRTSSYGPVSFSRARPEPRGDARSRRVDTSEPCISFSSSFPLFTVDPAPASVCGWICSLQRIGLDGFPTGSSAPFRSLTPRTSPRQNKAAAWLMAHGSWPVDIGRGHTKVQNCGVAAHARSVPKRRRTGGWGGIVCILSQ